jgi:hypothetical protein
MALPREWQAQAGGIPWAAQEIMKLSRMEMGDRRGALRFPRPRAPLSASKWPAGP